MAKQKGHTAGKIAAKNHPVSNRLKRELKNARKRVARAMEKLGGAYIGPSISDFYIANVQEKINAGVHVNSIYAAAKRATVENLSKISEERRRNPYVDTLYGGTPVTQREYSRLSKAIANANRNISAFISQNPELGNIAPSMLVTSDVLNKVTTRKGLRDITSTIEQAFKAKNFYAVPLNEDGEAGLKAELDYLQFFVTSENQRREKARQNAKALFNQTGLLVTQQEYGMSPLNTDNWDTLDRIRKRSKYFTEASDLNKASNWITEYIIQLEDLDAAMIINSGEDGTSAVASHISKIYKVLNKIISRENASELIRYLTQFSEYIAIQSNYIESADAIIGHFDILEQEFIRFEQEYL